MSLDNLLRMIRVRGSSRSMVDQALLDWQKQDDVESNANSPASVAKSGLLFFGRPEKVFDLEDLLPLNVFDFEDLLWGITEDLGAGSFGMSYKANLEDGTAVVVKKLKDVALNADEFKERVEVIGALQHENLLPLMAYYYRKDEKLLLSDYVPRGSLSLALHGRCKETRTPLARYNIALGVARAIEYLHSRGPGVFHGSIKPSNVLLTKSLTKSCDVLVSDYGLPYLQGKDAPNTKKLHWSSYYPRKFASDPHKADVYSFGVLLMELLTGKSTNSSSLVEEIDLPRRIQSIAPEKWAAEVFDVELLRYHNSKKGMTELLKMAVACTCQIPEMRPPISQVRQLIENLIISARAWQDEVSQLQPQRKLVNQVSDHIKHFEYVPSLYYHENDRCIVPPLPIVSRSTSDADSKLSPLDLASHHSSFDYPVSSIMVSDSTKPELEEGDPMLSDGSYDPSLSYVKRLPPSEEICHPHSPRDEPGLELRDPIPYQKPLPPLEDISYPRSLTDQNTIAVNFIQNGFTNPMVDKEDGQAKRTKDRHRSKSTTKLRNEAGNMEPPNGMSQVSKRVYGMNMQIQKQEEGITSITETNLKVTSNGDCAPSLAANTDSIKATTAHVHNSTQVPNTKLQKEEPCLQGDSSSLTSMTSGYDYDVFLSFRGPDARSCIVDFLYTSLLAAGVHTYRDNEELHIGEEIGLELMKAINQSKITIPIFSSGYASSKWCLNELAQMVECRKTRRQKIMPIFYNITPYDVRHQTGLYHQAFVSHENHFDCETINKWKNALSEVGKLKGWDISTETNRREGELVKLIVQEVISELKKAYLLVTDCLVGVDSHVKEISRMMIHDESKDVQVLLIHGMVGVGKTTLAKIIYNQLTHCFENCCFLSNIRETSEQKGIEHMQRQLISNILKRDWSDISNLDEGIKTIKERLCGKKVLLLLDDVDRIKHLDALMGKPAWFGLGSRIIITSRNRDIIDVHKVNHAYELVSMDFDQSLQLFCNHAFGREYPPDDYVTFSKEVVRITGGLPLALEAIGLLLHGKGKDVWDVTLKKLEKVPHKEVKEKLKISYDALDDQQKHMFLDIACLFIGFDKRVVLHMWDDLFPIEGLEVLQRMSLIKIEDNKLWMHVQLRDLGRDIVHQECNMELEKQTRLWDREEALDLVIRKKGTKEVEALCLQLDHRLLHYFASEEFSRLSKLRYVEIRLVQNDWPCHVYPINPLQRNPPILPELRWFSWHNFPLAIQLTHFSLMSIVILDLSLSKFTKTWDGWSHIKMAKNLKVLNLTGCAHLNATPDFSANVKLEHLILQNCGRLAHIDRSIGQLKHLKVLDLRFCIKLRKLPKELDNLESLKELLIDGTSIGEIPGWEGMKRLEILSACQCVALKDCRSIGNLASLLILNLSHTHIQELPNSLINLTNLRNLRMSGSSITRLPREIGMLEKLEEIDAEFCKHLEGVVPSDISKLSCLKIFKFSNTRICQVPRLPESLISLHIGTQSMNMLPDLSNLTNLIDLVLDILEVSQVNVAEANSMFRDYSKLVQFPSPWWIGKLCKLESLKLSCNSITALHTDIVLLSQLRKLELICCKLQFLPRLPPSLLCLHIKSLGSRVIGLSNLKELLELRIDSSAVTNIDGLADLENLKTLDFKALNSLERLPNLSNFKKLSELELRHCDNLVDIQSTEGLVSLRSLKIIEVPLLDRLHDTSNLKNLAELHLWGCRDLHEIQSFECLENLETLKLGEIPLVEALPVLSNLRRLKELHLWHCQSLSELQGLDGMANLITLKLGKLPLLERLPNMSNLKRLTKLEVRQCPSLVSIEGTLQSLEELWIDGCGSLYDVANLLGSKKLKSLQINDCEKLQLDKLWVSKLQKLGNGPENWNDGANNEIEVCGLDPQEERCPRTGTQFKRLGARRGMVRQSFKNGILTCLATLLSFVCCGSWKVRDRAACEKSILVSEED